MAASLPGQVPYAASTFPSDFDVQQNAALKQRRMADLLMQQAMAPDEKLAPGVRQSALAPLAKMFNAYVSTKLDKEASEQEKEAAAGRMSTLQNLLANPLKGTPETPDIPETPDTPAQPAANAMFGPTSDQNLSPSTAALATPTTDDTGAPTPPPPMLPQGLAAAFGPGGMPGSPLSTGAPGAPGASPDLGPSADAATQAIAPAPPMLPQTPPGLQDASGTPLMVPQHGATDMLPGAPFIKGTPALPPTSDEQMARAAQFAQLGPFGAKYAEKMMEAFSPKTGKDRYMTTANGDVLDLERRDKDGNPLYLPPGPETTAKLDAQIKEKRDALQQRADEAKQRSLDMRYSVDERAEAARQHNELLRALHAQGAAGESNAHTVGQAADGSGRVVEDKKGNQWLVDKDNNRTKFTGSVIPLATVEKETTDATKARGDLSSLDSISTTLNNNKGAYGSAGGVITALGGGTWSSTFMLSDKERQARASIQSRMAEITHRLYGSAFSAGEQYRAKPFVIDPGDTWEDAVSKLEAMRNLAKAELDKKGTVAMQQSEARAPGAGGGGGGASSGGQKVVPSNL